MHKGEILLVLFIVIVLANAVMVYGACTGTRQGVCEPQPIEIAEGVTIEGENSENCPFDCPSPTHPQTALAPSQTIEGFTAVFGTKVALYYSYVYRWDYLVGEEEYCTQLVRRYVRSEKDEQGVTHEIYEDVCVGEWKTRLVCKSTDPCNDQEGDCQLGGWGIGYGCGRLPIPDPACVELHGGDASECPRVPILHYIPGDAGDPPDCERKETYYFGMLEIPAGEPIHTQQEKYIECFNAAYGNTIGRYDANGGFTKIEYNCDNVAKWLIGTYNEETRIWEGGVCKPVPTPPPPPEECDGEDNNRNNYIDEDLSSPVDCTSPECGAGPCIWEGSPPPAQTDEKCYKSLCSPPEVEGCGSPGPTGYATGAGIGCKKIKTEISQDYINKMIDKDYREYHQEQTVDGNVLLSPFDNVDCSAEIDDPDINGGKKKQEGVSAKFELFATGIAKPLANTSFKSCGTLTKAAPSVTCKHTFDPSSYSLDGWPRVRTLYCKITPRSGDGTGGTASSLDKSTLLVARRAYYFLRVSVGGAPAEWGGTLNKWQTFLDMSEVNTNPVQSGKAVFLDATYREGSPPIFDKEGFYNKIIEKGAVDFLARKGIKIAESQDDKYVLVSESLPGHTVTGEPFGTLRAYTTWGGSWIVLPPTSLTRSFSHEMGHANKKQYATRVWLCDEYDYRLWLEENKDLKNRRLGICTDYPKVCDVTEDEFNKKILDYGNYIKNNPVIPDTDKRNFLKEKGIYFGSKGQSGCRGTPYIDRNTPEEGDQKASHADLGALNFMYQSISKGEKVTVLPFHNYQFYSVMGASFWEGITYVYPLLAQCPLRNCGVSPSSTPVSPLTGGVTLGGSITGNEVLSGLPQAENGPLQEEGPKQGSVYEISLKVVGISNVTETYDEFNWTEFTDYNVSILSFRQRNNTISEYYDFNSTPTEYSLNITMLSREGDVLENYYLTPDFYIPEIGLLTQRIETFYLPYHSDVKYLKIFYNGTEKLSMDLEQSLCNNDTICSGFENYFSCPSDCPINATDGICASVSGDGICDPDCYFDDDCCHNGIIDPNEAGIDCGGICKPCQPPAAGLKSILSLVKSWVQGYVNLTEIFGISTTPISG